MSYLGYKVIKTKKNKLKNTKYSNLINDDINIVYIIKYKKQIQGAYTFNYDKQKLVLKHIDSAVSKDIPKKIITELEKEIEKELQIYLTLEEYSEVIWNKKKIEPIYLLIGKKNIRVSMITILTWSIIGILGTILGVMFNLNYIIAISWIISSVLSILVGYLIINKNSV